MSTLRRKLIQKFEEVFAKVSNSEEYPFKLTDTLAEIFADAALEVFNDKPKIDLAKADPAWAILYGNTETIHEAVTRAKGLQDARSAFERDMRFNPLPWDSTKDWQKLSEFVEREYEKDNLIFAKYRTWQQDDGKYVALSNRKIKERPADFIACFPDFLAHTAMYSKPVEKVDDDGFEFNNEIYI